MKPFRRKEFLLISNILLVLAQISSPIRELIFELDHFVVEVTFLKALLSTFKKV